MPAMKNLWGKDLATEFVQGIPYKMYTDRPRRVSELLDLCERWGDRPHIIHDNRTMTFSGLRNAVAAKASALSHLGLTQGDRVFVLGWNSPEWVVNFWACIQIGCIPVLANAWWSSTEVSMDW